MEHQQFVVEGVKAVKELLRSDYKTLAVYITDKNVLSFEKTEPVAITETQLGKISNLETPNKVLAIAEIPKSRIVNHKQLKNRLSLALDNMNDPGNLGTIIRTAAWFGIETVFCSENTVDAWNPKTVQATMGALFNINVVYTDLKKLVKNFNQENIPVYATALEGKNIYKSKLNTNGLIIIGSESHGISQELLSLVSQKLHIPSFSKNAAESLNAAVATGIVCSEFRRKKFWIIS